MLAIGKRVPNASRDDVITRLGHDKKWLQGRAVFVEASCLLLRGSYAQASCVK